MNKKQASEFLRVFSKGEGDSVKEYEKLWKGKSLEDIQRMLIKFQDTEEMNKG